MNAVTTDQIAQLASAARAAAAAKASGYANATGTIGGKWVEVSASRARGHNAFRLNWSVGGKRVSAAKLAEALGAC